MSNKKAKMLPNELLLDLQIGERILTYSKLSIEELKFPSQLLDFYPQKHRNLVFPVSLPEFCFPSGLYLCTDPIKITPKFFTFVLTNERGSRVYVACLCIYEKTSEVLFKSLQHRAFTKYKDIFVPKALCLISRFSFIPQFKGMLKQLYRLSLSKLAIPIEVIFA
eukprot:TRINITY_DN10352_c0_g4_i1.p1 TRINITY_DN10352_c0_g4~~TRINITY_DN10352_c0_g4_i1.p1  ORF type:complete len:165 (+),score=18.29 TRINITY_DN10352_c0_g4_i1:218-712(+)